MPAPLDEGFELDLGEIKNDQLKWHTMPIPAIRPRDLQRVAGDVVDIVMNSVTIAYIRVRKVNGEQQR